MPNKEEVDGLCNAKVRPWNTPDDWDLEQGFCANPEGFRTPGDSGRCYLHGGVTAHTNKGNNHAEKHGLYSDRQNYYKHRSDSERRWIDAVVESLLDDAPFGPDSFAKLQMVRNIAIDMHKMQNANDYIDEVGVAHRDKTVGYTDNGKPIKEDQENVLNISYDRLSRNVTRQLKELGILDDPDSQKAEAQQNIAKELGELRKARNEQESK